MALFSKLFGAAHEVAVAKYRKIPALAAPFEDTLKTLSDDALRSKTVSFKERLAQGATADDLLPEAFAVVREAASRTLGLRPYDVQLIGGAILHGKNIAEMRTGEGKTLVATLPVYLNALMGKGVHVVTVNDYLARRDAVWMGEIYAALGLSVAVINHDSSFIYDETHTTNAEKKDAERDIDGSFRVVHEFLRPISRREAYAADITYGTNSEFGFDYLRDNIQYDPARTVQRGHYFAVVDEVDSILIDEARTPLIISAPVGESESLYKTFTDIARGLAEGEHYTVDEKLRAIQLTDAGIEKTEKILGVDNIYTDKGIKFVHHLETAVRAKALFHRERDYVVKDGEVIIVDQSTGRLQPGRRWSEGLHQAVESKEGVPVQEESRTFASVTYQNYFRMYERLSGMTGTALTSAEEFAKVYGLEVVPVPTHKEVHRIDHNDLVFQTEMGKFQAVAKKIKELNEKGQPVLVGTVSIEKNELLSAFLNSQGIRHEILNAKNHEREGEIIARAGAKGAVTLATNMAGRGVDIKLGGIHATSEEYEEVKRLGGLFVLGTERHDARRIDNQLRGRAGRQGDPGETQFFVSLEDPLMKVFGSERVKSMMGRFGIPEDQPIESRLVSRSLESAQEKVEGFNFDSRKHVLEYDDVLNYQRKIVYERRRSVLFGDTQAIENYLEQIVAGDEARAALIKEKRATLGESQFILAVRMLILQVTDLFWVEHLESMEHLRASVRLRAYGQRDPLIEYKRDGLALYKQMESAIMEEVAKLIPNIGGIAPVKEEQNLKEVRASAIEAGKTSDRNTAPTADSSVGRNDPCPCGSGLKYKKCGLINAPEHKK